MTNTFITKKGEVIKPGDTFWFVNYYGEKKMFKKGPEYRDRSKIFNEHCFITEEDANKFISDNTFPEQD